MMDDDAVSTNLIFKLSIEKYDRFCVELESNVSQPSDLTFFKNEHNCTLINQLCEVIFSEEIDQIIREFPVRPV